MKFLDKLKAGLAKTKAAIVDKIEGVFKAFVKVDEALFDELEEALICADIGVPVVMDILDRLRDEVKTDRLKDPAEVKERLYAMLTSMIGEGEPLHLTTRP